MSVHVISEARRCLQCKNPLCLNKGCPIRTNIPEMIRLFLDGKISEAGNMLFENNPLSIMCSLVCDHGKQCEGNCVQGIKGSSIHISSIEHYISNSYLDKMVLERDRKKNKRIAVIGSGPAGLALSIKLAQKGYDVTIFEQKNYIGGMLRYGIPDFRLPKTILDRFRQKLSQLGIMIRPNTTIGGALRLDDLFSDGYQAVFIGTGVWRARRLGVPGETLGNVHYAVDYLQNPDIYELGEHIAIIGAGNSAMDVARTAIRKGAQHVSILCRKSKCSASDEEVEYTITDGADILYNTGVQSITPSGPMIYHIPEKKEPTEENGEKKEAEPEKEIAPQIPTLFQADSVIIAVSQSPKNKIVSSTHGIEVTEKGLIKVDENGMTTREGVFSAGDVVTGPSTVVAAVRDAKMVAESIDRFLQAGKKGA